MLNAPYSHRTGGECLNGTVMGTLAVGREAQCCSACSAAGPRCAGWTVRSAGGARTCELLVSNPWLQLGRAKLFGNLETWKCASGQEPALGNRSYR